jgi:hypothetical protein
VRSGSRLRGAKVNPYETRPGIASGLDPRAGRVKPTRDGHAQRDLDVQRQHVGRLG